MLKYQTLQCVRLRVAKLTSSGAPSVGASNGYVSDGIIDLTVGVELTTGDDFEKKKGDGTLCGVFKDVDRIKRLNLSATFCELDAALLEFLTGADPFVSGGNAVGWQYPSISAAAPNGVSLEVWTKAWAGSQQAVDAFSGVNAAYHHWVFPRVKMVLGDLKFANEFADIPMTGTSEENAFITANGPFNDWPAAIAASGGVTRVGGEFLDSTLPAASSSKIAVPSGS